MRHEENTTGGTACTVAKGSPGDIVASKGRLGDGSQLGLYHRAGSDQPAGVSIQGQRESTDRRLF